MNTDTHSYSRAKKSMFMGFIRVHLCLSVVVLAVLAGCAEMRWSKPGTDPAKVEEDLAQCRGEARLHAARVAPRSTGLPGVLPTDPMGRPVPAPNRGRTEDPALLEQDLTGACMRAKGYALVPADR